MSFDYIIIGGGTAGCVLAARLSEDPKATVLLIEAGGYPHDVRVSMPAGYPALQKTARDWAFWTTQQPQLHNRKLFQPRGKMLGGTGTMNGMIYMRGHATDYAQWASAADDSWRWDSVLSYFKKSENNLQFTNDAHAQNGPWTISSPAFRHPLNEAFLEAGTAQQIPWREDFNNGETLGVGWFQGCIAQGKRHSTYHAFLKPALQRKNLTVWTNTLTHQIDIQPPRAKGVWVSRGKAKKQWVEATHAVVLAAGAIQSPQLLMLSGIGDPAHLQSKGIQPLVESPEVGQNLQDHWQYFLGYTCPQKITLNSAVKLSNLWQYFVHKKGIFANLISAAGGFVSTQNNTIPDIQFHFVPGLGGDDIHDMANQPKTDGFMLGLTLLKPESKGQVTLSDNLPDSPPLIDPNFGTAAKDWQTLIEAYAIGEAIVESPALAPFRKTATKPKHRLNSLADKENFIRQTLESVYHSCGSCRMGSDLQAVVDPQLRVNGVDNLYVADASIMPTIPAGNIQAAIVMIAEKAAVSINS